MKTFFITLASNITALLIVGGLGFYLGTGYVEAKLAPITATVEHVNAVVERVDTTVDDLKATTASFRDKLTETTTFQRYFPQK